MRGILSACAWVACAFVPALPHSHRSRAVTSVSISPAATAQVALPSRSDAAPPRPRSIGRARADVVAVLAALCGTVGVVARPKRTKNVSVHPRAGLARRAPAPLLMADPSSGKKSPLDVIPFLQRDVPVEQQPAVELRELQNQPFYDWAEDDERYEGKLFDLYRFISLFASLPIAYTTYHRLPFELPQLLLSANIGTLAVMTPFVARLRVGYGYVSERLRARKIYYEAQQRGLFAQKEPESLLRDRLTEKSKVAPAIKRIDKSIATLLIAGVLSVGSAEALTIIEGEAGPATLQTFVGADADRLTVRLRSDPEFAEREQKRAQAKGNADGTGVKPVYCESRYYKIVAGGGNC